MKVTYCDRCQIPLTDEADAVDVTLAVVSTHAPSVSLLSRTLNLCKDDYDAISAAIQTAPSLDEMKRRAAAKAALKAG